MALPRDKVTHGLLAELGSFETLLRSLDDLDWESPTRCAGWSVADVAAHLVGTMTDITLARFDGLGTPEVTARQVDERRGRSPAGLADELAVAAKGTDVLLGAFDDSTWAMPAPGGYDGTLGEGVEALWYDAFLHADDIRAGAGRPSEPGNGEGLLASVSHVAAVLTARGWGPATLALDGLPEFAVGDGSGPRLTGDPLTFVLAATGRADPAPLGLDETVNIYR